MNYYYITKPHVIGLDKLGLKYVDLLTYVAIKSFLNHDKNDCFPAYETVGHLIGASRSFIAESVSRLEKSGLMVKHNRPNTSNTYYFRSSRKDLTSKIPVQLLRLDLSVHEKAMLLMLRQFDAGTITCIMHDINWIANQLGVTYKTVYTQVQALINKGYLVEKKVNKKTYYELTDLFDWYFEWDKPEGNKNHTEDYLLQVA